ncbi:MAG: response regulator transcription factor [Chloroflexota bacterium]
MTMTVVLIAETRSNFISALQKHYTTHVVRSGRQGIDKVKETEATLIILDAISLKTSGTRICKQLRNNFPNKHIIHLHDSRIKKQTSPADTVLCTPIPVRKLMTAIELLTSNKRMRLVECDKFLLDLDRRVLIAHDNETVLSPKEAKLIEAFLTHPNETLDRKWLMQHIWDTDYTGDTRTLNVHIRSVRQAMEVNASKPQYIKTVRGKGYRFEVSLNKKPTH